MIEQTLKTGTTTLGIVCKEGVVLAADKKTTLGGQIVSNIKTEKIIIINNRIAVTMAGLVSDVQLLTKIIRAQIKLEELRRGKRLSAKEATNLLANLVYNNIRKMSTIPGIVGFLVAAADDNEVQLYEIGIDGSVAQFDNYAADGSGMMFALGVLDAEYKPTPTLEEAKFLAIKAINSAIQRDTASGGGIDVIVVTKEGIKPVHSKLIENKL